MLQVHSASFPNTARTSAMPYSRTDTVSIAGRYSVSRPLQRKISSAARDSLSHPSGVIREHSPNR